MPSYLQTPLAKKLGIKKGNAIYLGNAPNDYFEVLKVIESDFQLVRKPGKEILDFAHVFVSKKDDLESIAQPCTSWLKKPGMIWVSWPKGSSKIPTDLKRDPIREYLLDLGLVDVKVASYDEDWSGLKFVYRVKDR